MRPRLEVTQRGAGSMYRAAVALARSPFCLLCGAAKTGGTYLCTPCNERAHSAANIDRLLFWISRDWDGKPWANIDALIAFIQEAVR